MLKNIFQNSGLKNGDKVLVSANTRNFLIKNRKNFNFAVNSIIDMLIETVGKSGTIILPAFNWDFCRGVEFHYKKTSSHSGALGKVALDRKDFIRSKNPIYSFIACGKDSNLISELKHESCFGLDSPLGYLLKNKGKNLFLDLDYKEGGFVLIHVAEQSAKVSYRFHKNFTGFYTGKDHKRIKSTYSMYVRDPKSRVLTTFVHKDFDEVLKSSNAMTNTFTDGFNINIIDMKKAYDLLVEDMKKKGNLTYTTHDEKQN